MYHKTSIDNTSDVIYYMRRSKHGLLNYLLCETCEPGYIDIGHIMLEIMS